ncbi:MAG: hypothetical protein KatS3mg102_0467 [Planctomycetota bacterium]|nr:MAG: hypothetical protein KatS3mg102_0467 [Planctomycetota bacterium]
METLTRLLNATPAAITRHRGRIYGFVPGIVIAVVDRNNPKRHEQGYVQVYFPGLQLEADHVRTAASDPERGQSPLRDADQIIAPWARLCAPNAGPGAGVYQVPQLGDEVLCAFEHGDPRHPYVVGSLYNGVDKLPKPVTDPKIEGNRPQDKGCPATPDMAGAGLAAGGGKNKVMFWRSRSGNVLALNDETGVMRLSDRSGHSAIQIDGDKIEILQTAKQVRINACNKIRFDCTDFKVNAKKDVIKVTTTHSATAGSNYQVSAEKTFCHWAKANFTVMAGKDVVANSSDMLEVQAKSGNGSFMAGGEMLIAAPDSEVALKAGANLTLMTPAKLLFASSNDMKLKAGGGVNVTAGAISMKGATAQLNCGADAGFSLFDAIWNGFRSLVTKVVKGVIGVAKAVGGAVVAGARALGRATVAAVQAIGRVAGAAARAVVRAHAAVMQVAWNGVRRVGRALFDVGGEAARPGICACNCACQNLERAGQRAAQTMAQGAQLAGQEALAGGSAGPLMRAAADEAGAQIEDATEALQQTNLHAAGQVIRDAEDADPDEVRELERTVNQENANLGRAAQQFDEDVHDIGNQTAQGLDRIAQQAHAGPGQALDLDEPEVIEMEPMIIEASPPSQQALPPGEVIEMEPMIIEASPPRSSSHPSPGQTDQHGRLAPPPPVRSYGTGGLALALE